MTDLDVLATSGVTELGPGGGRLASLWGFLRRHPQAMFACGILLVFALVAILAPVIEPFDPKVKSGPVFAPPSSEHLLGTDSSGVDVLSGVIAGARVSLIVGLAAGAVSMAIGGTIGIVAGYRGGWVDSALMHVTDYMIVIPGLPLMMVVAALFGRSLGFLVLIIGLIFWTTTARLIRAQVRSVRERTYVRRAESLGAGPVRIVVRHVLPQIAPLLVANTVIMVATAIFAETYIAFLGLGDPSLISWGRLIQGAFTGGAVANGAWWVIVFPGLCVVFVVLACTMLGQTVEDALNPRLRSSHLSIRSYRVRRKGP